jgi:archaellum component FlaF (FlaF/FlaG flagellin family)
LFNRLLKNKKGTAEVIGSVMFIVILLFFFTNVYLWHDAATKEMNDLQIQKINSRLEAVVSYDAPSKQYNITVTNKGGVDATLSILWVTEKVIPSSQSQNTVVNHLNIEDNRVKNLVVGAGGDSESKTISGTLPFTPTGGNTLFFKVITTTGNPGLASCKVPLS